MVRIIALALLALAPIAADAQAQTWPNRPVRIVVPSPPAGGTDIVARVMADISPRRSSSSSSSRTAPAPAT